MENNQYNGHDYAADIVFGWQRTAQDEQVYM